MSELTNNEPPNDDPERTQAIAPVNPENDVNTLRVAPLVDPILKQAVEDKEVDAGSTTGRILGSVVATEQKATGVIPDTEELNKHLSNIAKSRQSESVEPPTSSEDTK